MAVEFNRNGSKMTYRLIAEEADTAVIKESLETVKEAKGTRKGMSKDGTMRLALDIPEVVLYNYLAINGIQWRDRLNWLKDKKNLKRLKSEFPMFTV